MEIVSQSVVEGNVRRVSWVVHWPYNHQDTVIVWVDDGCDNCHHRWHIADNSVSDQCYPHTNHTGSWWDPQGPWYDAFVVLKNEWPRWDAICPNFGRKFEPKNTRR